MLETNWSLQIFLGGLSVSLGLYVRIAEKRFEPRRSELVDSE
jgi:hypothetical protein